MGLTVFDILVASLFHYIIIESLNNSFLQISLPLSNETLRVILEDDVMSVAPETVESS